MSWSDGQCPWSYRMQNVDMMPTCVYTPGMAGLSDGEYNHGQAAAAAAGQGLAPVGGRISEVMNVPAGGMDWTTIAIYAGAALVVIMILSKGRR